MNSRHTHSIEVVVEVVKYSALRTDTKNTIIVFFNSRTSAVRSSGCGSGNRDESPVFVPGREELDEPVGHHRLPEVGSSEERRTFRSGNETFQNGFCCRSTLLHSSKFFTSTCHSLSVYSNHPNTGHVRYLNVLPLSGFRMV